MPSRRVLAAATVAALAVPAGALADSIGPHASLYIQHPGARKPGDNVSVLVHRNTGITMVNVSNFCLGSGVLKVPGLQPVRYPNSASAKLRLRRGALSFNGRASLYQGQRSTRKIRMVFSAKVAARKVTGRAGFPGTRCGTLRFTAPLRERTK